jgi:capsular polysaccharide biosynthesis protein
MIIKTKKLITAIWKHKLMFIILSIAFLAIGVGVVHLINANVKQAQIRIALSYPGIEKGSKPRRLKIRRKPDKRTRNNRKHHRKRNTT